VRSGDVPVCHNAEARLQAVRAPAQVNMGDQLVVGTHGVVPNCPGFIPPGSEGRAFSVRDPQKAMFDETLFSCRIAGHKVIARRASSRQKTQSLHEAQSNTRLERAIGFIALARCYLAERRRQTGNPRPRKRRLHESRSTRRRKAKPSFSPSTAWAPKQSEPSTPR
jgi:hypothetical protein